MSVFLSTPSARRATQGLEQYNRHNQNFYPRPLRGGRPSATAKYTASKNFYPRPLRGGRLLLVFEQAGLFVISIHALCEEGDRILERLIHNNRRFLSTPSARRATQSVPTGDVTARNFYPRPLRGGRPLLRTFRRFRCYFYPRPLRGGRPWRLNPKTAGERFLSTPSARRATGRYLSRDIRLRISIHALCEEGDDANIDQLARENEFLSTPSARRATRPSPSCWMTTPYFYPRPLRGGRPPRTSSMVLLSIFLSTPSARRATTSLLIFRPSQANFYPRPLRGGRPTGLSA